MLARRDDGFPLARLREEMDHLFDSFFRDGSLYAGLGAWGESREPALNLGEDDQNLYVEAELPGVLIEDVDIQVLGNELTLRGERKDPAGDDVTVLRRERPCGPFARTVHLPVEIDADQVRATMKDGVLTVCLAKAQAARPRRIEVKVS